MSYLYQHSGKNISLAAGSCLTAPIICGSTCVRSAVTCATSCVQAACVYSTGNICGHEICAGSWLRTGTSAGLYNSGTGVHWYSTASNLMRLYPGSANNISLQFYSCGAARSCINANCDNQLHIYDSGGTARSVSYTHLTLPTNREV